MYLNSVLPSEFAPSCAAEPVSLTEAFITSCRCRVDITSKFSALPTFQLNIPFPKELRETTLELASNHLICSVALTGIVILQAGRLWAEKADEDDDDFVMVDTELEPSTTAKSSVAPSRAKTPDHDIVKPLRVETTN